MTKKFLTIEELSDYLNVGRNNARIIGMKAGAVAKVGRRNLYNVSVIDEYVDANYKQLLGANIRTGRERK